MKIVTETQYSSSWWAARRGLPTSSNFGKIITPAKGELSKQAEGYACELVAQLYDPYYGEVEDYQSAAMKNGTILEPEARAFYEFERNAEVNEVGLCVSDCGRYGGSPDGLIGDDGCLEIKSVEGKTQIGYLEKGVLPTAHKVQCHGHLVVTGREWCDFFSYSPGLPPFLVRVFPDGYTYKVKSSVENFCDSLDVLRAKIAKMKAPPDLAEEPDESDVVLW